MTEGHFELDELFVSTTDPKGHIRACNDVFVRVSGYAADELLGRAHNVIRHPDMPRGVFQVFWDRLGAGRPVAAYVENRAKGGSPYWVMAVAVPVPGGYASVRLKPTASALFDAAQGIYAELVALEHEFEAGDPRRRKPAIAASVARLDELLAGAGFASYDAFMRAALVAEVTGRAALLAGAAQGPPVAPVANPAIAQLLRATLAMRGVLDGALGSIAGYAEVAERLGGTSAFVRGLSDDLRLFSLNALLAASRLTDGAPLSAVAALQRSRFDALAPHLEALGTALAEAEALLGEMSFRAAASHVQSEMMATFAREHAADAEVSPALAEQLTTLTSAVTEAVDSLAAGLTALDAALARLSAAAARVDRELAVVHALEVNGRIEAARAPDTDHVRTLFTEMGDRITAARAEVATFVHLDRTLTIDPTIGPRTTEHLHAVHDAVRALA